MLTMNNRFANITIAIGVAVFLFPIQAMSRTGKSLTASSDSRPKVAFFIGEIMKICKVESTIKGLCRKHYMKQWYRDNKERITKQHKQYNLDHKEEIAKIGKQYYQNNKERITEQHKQWYLDNPEYDKQYFQEHKEEKTRYNKQWYKNNKERKVEYDRQYVQDNKEKRAKQRKQWCEDNPEWQKQYNKTPAGRANIKAGHHNRRTLEKDLTLAMVQRVYEANIAKYEVLTCYLCFKPIVNNNDSLEHSTPLSRGGSNNYDNLGVAHRSCNAKKHTKTLEEWKSYE